MTDILKQLKRLADPAYRKFITPSVATVPAEQVIGVRVPAIRRLATSLNGTPEAEAFLGQLPHSTLEENHLHAFLLEKKRDYEDFIQSATAFLPYVNNWATCDMMSNRVMCREPQKAITQAYAWMDREHPFTVRYGIKVLMDQYLDSLFSVSQAQRVADLRREEYYIVMMQAWYFATALAKQPKAIFPFFEQDILTEGVFKKAVSKSLDSYRIPAETKEALRRLRKERVKG